MEKGSMTVSEREWFASRVREAEEIVAAVSQTIKRLRPVLGTEDADTAQRNALQALRSLGRVRRATGTASVAETGSQVVREGTPDDGTWSVEYHRMSPARLNPDVCTCGLGPSAVVHNEPPHRCSSRPTAPHQIPVAGLCTLCHHHETSPCHITTVTECDTPAPAVPASGTGLRCTCTPSFLAERGFLADPACPMHGHLAQPPVVPAVSVPPVIEPPGEAVILAARHLDATEGPVRVGSTVDTSARGAINTVLRYVAKAHNSRRDV